MPAQYGIVKQFFKPMDHIDAHRLMNSPYMPHAGHSQGSDLRIDFERRTVEQNSLNPLTVRIVIRQRQ